jgi:Family of unknown function (DUF6502)
MPRAVSKRKRLSRVMGAPTNRALSVSLLQELHQLILDVGVELGISEKEQRRAIELAVADKKRLRPSQTTMQNEWSVAALLGKWRSDKRYRGNDGTPRALSIMGKGATLQTLAREYVPLMPIRELVDLLCLQSEVTRFKGDKVALIGSPVIMTEKTPELTLASLIIRIRRVAGTMMHNAAIPAGVKNTGRFERIVGGHLSDKDFQKFGLAIRTQLQEVCDRVDSGMQQPKGQGKRTGKIGGVGIYVFREDGGIF